MDLFSSLVGELSFITAIKPRPTTTIAISLNNLPDKILMLIIHDIYNGTDKASLFAFFALRQFSRRFRRLTKDNAFDLHVFSDKDCCELCLGSPGAWARGETSPDPLTGIDSGDPTVDAHISKVSLYYKKALLRHQGREETHLLKRVERLPQEGTGMLYLSEEAGCEKSKWRLPGMRVSAKTQFWPEVLGTMPIF
ncbi:hypothetical protein F52700_887 [Fusarium sp. NRRL 52700]|nr:hypothetical protein F52700_887 [Fusarium sp. NRRL 52700]